MLLHVMANLTCHGRINVTHTVSHGKTVSIQQRTTMRATLLLSLYFLMCCGSLAETLKAVVTQQPNWPQVFKEEKITLKCEVQGEPKDWWYDWYENGNPLDFPKEKQEITFLPGEIPDHGAYKCLATNKKNKILSVESETYNMHGLDSPKVTLTVLPMPLFSSGDKVTLRCDIKAQEKGWDYHWVWDGRTLPDKTSKTITVTMPHEKGRYYCFVRRKGSSNLMSSSDVAAISARYLHKTTMTVSPQPPFSYGDRITLSCDRAQGDDWEYSWGKDNRLIDDKTSKTISVRVPDESGQYHCYGRMKGSAEYEFISDYVYISHNQRPNQLVLGLCVAILVILVVGLLFVNVKNKCHFFRPPQPGKEDRLTDQDQGQYGKEGPHTYESIPLTDQSPADASVPGLQTVYALLKPDNETRSSKDSASVGDSYCLQ